MKPAEVLNGFRKEATQVLYENGVPVAILLRDEKSRHSVLYRLEELGQDDVADLIDSVAKATATAQQ